MKPPISDTVRAAMQAAGLSQKALAKQSGVDRANLNRWLRGRGTLTVASLERLLAVLGLGVR